MHVEKTNAYRVLVGKAKGIGTFWRCERRRD